MFPLLSTVGILLLGQLTKKYIIPKFGKYGFYAFLFIVAIVANAVYAAMTVWPSFGALLVEAGKFLTSSIGLYEIFLNDVMNTPVPPELVTPVSAPITANA